MRFQRPYWTRKGNRFFIVSPPASKGNAIHKYETGDGDSHRMRCGHRGLHLRQNAGTFSNRFARLFLTLFFSGLVRRDHHIIKKSAACPPLPACYLTDVSRCSFIVFHPGFLSMKPHTFINIQTAYARGCRQCSMSLTSLQKKRTQT